MNDLASKYPEEIKNVLARYPQENRRSAVMPLIYLAQREKNFVTQKDMSDIAEICEISSTDVAGLIGFYTLYHDIPAGKYYIQVCTDLPCALRGSELFLEKLCDNLGVRVGETTEDGLFTIESVTCLAGCDHAPLFQVQSGKEIVYHQDQTIESAIQVLDGLRQDAASGDGEVRA